MTQRPSPVSRTRWQRVRPWLQRAWVLLVVVCVVVYVSRHGDQLLDALHQVEVGWLAVAVGLAVARRLAGGWRWVEIVSASADRSAANADRPTNADRSLTVCSASREALVHLRIYLLTNLANYIPGGVWSSVSRVHASGQAGVSAQRSLSGVIYETGLLVGGGLAVGLYAAVWWVAQSPSWSLVAAAIGLLASVAAVMPVSLRLIHASVRALLGAGDALRRWWSGSASSEVDAPASSTPADLPPSPPWRWSVAVWISSMAVWAFGGLSLCCVLRALEPTVPWSSVWLVTSTGALGWTAGFLVIWAPNGLGVREWVMAEVLVGLAPMPVLWLAVAGARAVTLAEDLLCAAIGLALPKAKSLD